MECSCGYNSNGVERILSMVYREKDKEFQCFTRIGCEKCNKLITVICEGWELVVDKKTGHVGWQLKRESKRVEESKMYLRSS